MSIKQQTFSAIRWTTLAMLGKALLQFGQTVVLARMLAPADFGLLSMILAVMAFIQVFTDLGVSNAIIYHQKITPNQLSSLYWLNVVCGQCLMLLLLLFAPLISQYLFHQPDLQPALAGMSCSILLASMSQQVRVLAEKSLRFAILAKIEISAALVGVATALTWAFYSPSVYALIAGTLTSGFVQTLLLWLLASNGWRPKLRLNFKEIRQFLTFGGFTIANNLVNSINSQADILIAGRVFPADLLGFYSLPRNLSLTLAGVINPIITRVGSPVMAKAQDDKLFLKSVYLKTMLMSASINIPLYLSLATFSDEVVIVVFGQNWLASSPLLKSLALWGLFRSFGNPVGSLLLAVGKADLSFKWNLALLLIVPPALFWFSHYGIANMAVAQAVLMALLILPAWYFLVWPSCGARIGEYFRTLLNPLLAASIAVVLGIITTFSINVTELRVAIAFLVILLSYLATSYVVNRIWFLAIYQLIRNK